LAGVVQRLLAPNAPGVNYSIVTDTSFIPGLTVLQQVVIHLQVLGLRHGIEVLYNSIQQ
jgi:general secretion pathway protein K